jgi:hypothetical protein
MNWFKGLLKDEERWAIHCDYHSWTVQDLSKDQAIAVLDTLKDTQKSSVMVWRTGWAGWRNLRDPECSDLMQPREVKVQAPPVPTDENFDPEITAVRSVAAQNPFMTRKGVRFDVEYPVVVVSSNQEFKTQSLDLSEGGLRVKDTLPDWVAGYCSVILHVENGRKIELMCSLAEDQKHSKTRFEIVPSEKQSEFLDWFQSKFKVSG